MKLSRNFVSEYVDLPSEIDIKKLADDMTNVGNEYDSCGKLLPCGKLIIGEVLECSDHPDSDHLHLCKVNIGNQVLQIVCGAPNVRKGLKVIVAVDGTELPGGVIKKGIIRGQESNGMLCSIKELGLENKFLREEDINGIHEFPSDAKVGEDAIKYLGLDDEVIDFELTSNRGDLLSILGMAYEIGAIYDKKVKEIDLSFKENKEDINNSFSLDIRTDNCPLFLAKKVKNVVIKESPDFIKNRLIASGIRPINNVVDISNYVMLETGQPLHYYDSDRLGNKIVVRMANDSEKLTTLDNEERILSNQDIVIANDKEAVGLAGVMGGLTTEIEDDTKNIIIEAAIFNPTLIRKTSKKIVRSEASNRFEKGLDPNRTYMAILRSCHLLEKYADAEVVSGMAEYNTLDIKDKTISITKEKINKVLGMELDKNTILNIFKRLGFEVKDGNPIKVNVPSRRTDISIEEDLIEEIGRIYGIDNIIGKKMTLPVKPGTVNKNNRIIRNKLASLGLNETLSYALVKESMVGMYTNDTFEKIKVLDPMSEDRNTLRYSLIPSLVNIYEYNKARGNKDICIYEIGKGFGKNTEGEYFEENKLAILMTGDYSLGLHITKVNFYTIKGVVEELLEYLGYKNRYSFQIIDLPKELHPGQSASIILNGVNIGIIGKVHPSIMKDSVYVAEINLEKLLTFKVKKMQYKEISKFPGIKKDIAFVVDKKVSASDIVEVIKKAGGKLLADINIFDVYQGENIGMDKKSIAFSLNFEDQSRTLNDEEVMKVFNEIIDLVSKKLNASVRDK